MLTIAPQTMERAFESYVTHYVNEDSRAWSIEHQIGLYNAAEKAFGDDGSFDDFATIYEALRRWWKVFRNGKDCWTAKKTFQVLRSFDPSLRARALSQMAVVDWGKAWQCLENIKGIKQNKSGYLSLVAISKFLHFWNPRLFVICDAAAVEGYALRHSWIRRFFPSADDARSKSGLDIPFQKGLGWYLRLLIFAGELVRTNPHLAGAFEATVRSHAGKQKVPDDIVTYEATAVEWCLLGLVELPPTGVTLQMERQW